MYSKVFSIALFSVLARVAFAQDFTFATPQLVQCKEAEFQWQGGNPGYAVYVLPFNDPCGDAVAEVGTTPNTSQNWNVTIPAGSQVQLLVEDSDSNEAWTGTITVQPSDDSSCIDPNAVKVLGAAGALGVTSTVVSSTAIVSSSAVSSTTGAAAAALTPLPPAIASPIDDPSSAVASGSIASGIANAAQPGVSAVTASGAMSVAVPAASMLGLTTLLLAIFQL